MAHKLWAIPVQLDELKSQTFCVTQAVDQLPLWSVSSKDEGCGEVLKQGQCARVIK